MCFFFPKKLICCNLKPESLYPNPWTLDLLNVIFTSWKENKVGSCGVKHWLGVKTAPFPVMSVMNVTTVISNSRGKKNLKKNL